MAKNCSILAAVVAVIAAVMVAGNAQMSPAGAPGPGPATLDCFPYLLNVSDCLSYVGQGSNLTAPEKPCCPEVKTLLEVQPMCLCELLASPDKAPVPIDVGRATALPSVCNIDLPLGLPSPAAACALLGVPVGAPAPATATATGAPAPAIAAPPSDSSSGLPLSPNGSPSAPSSPNDGQRIAGSKTHFLFLFASVVVAFLGFF